MTKKINEAAVKLDVVGLESDDLATLAQILTLAGAAESSSLQASPYPVQPEIEIDTPVEPVVDELPVQTDIDVQEPVQDDEFEEYSEEVPVNADDEFDIGLMNAMAGLHESTDGTWSVEGNESTELDSHEVEADINEDVDSEYDEITEDVSEDESTDAVEELDENLLPDLSLSKDEVQEDVEEVEEYGPFSSEMAASTSAQHETNGVEGDNFIVYPKGNAFYWKRTMQEDVDFRPEDCEVDTAGIRNSVHSYKDKRNHLGDNPILARETVNDESDVLNAGEDDNDDLEKLRESLNARYNKFIGK